MKKTINRAEQLKLIMKQYGVIRTLNDLSITLSTYALSDTERMKALIAKINETVSHTNSYWDGSLIKDKMSVFSKEEEEWILKNLVMLHGPWFVISCIADQSTKEQADFIHDMVIKAHKVASDQPAFVEQMKALLESERVLLVKLTETLEENRKLRDELNRTRAALEQLKSKPSLETF